MSENHLSSDERRTESEPNERRDGDTVRSSSDDAHHPSAEDAYADWTLPGQDSAANADDLGPPTAYREPLLRDRIRDRLGVTPQQWYVVESLLLVVPYPLFIYAYLELGVGETLFLAVTLAYSLVAMYVGFLS